MNSPRAFTLMELAVSMAIAGIVTFIAVETWMMISAVLRSNQSRARLTEQAAASLDYVLEEAARAGGGGVPLHSSIIVEQDCGPRGPYPDCQGTDRVTVVQALPGYRTCSIVAEPSAGVIEVARLADGTTCCLADAPTATDGPFKRQMMLARATATPGELPAMVTLTSPASCTFRYQPLIPPEDMPRPLPAGFNFAGGAAQLVDVKTFYVEFQEARVLPYATRGTLVMHAELDGNLAQATGERLDLAPDLYDFQVTLGFNRAASDLVAVESAASPETDDWAFNDAADDTGFDYGTLTMVGTSVLVGARDVVSHGPTLSAPWGPARAVPPGFRAMAAAGRIGLRSLTALPPPPPPASPTP